MLTCVVYPDDDERRYFAGQYQSVSGLVDAPHDSAKGFIRIAKILSIVHVQHRIALFGT